MTREKKKNAAAVVQVAPIYADLPLAAALLSISETTVQKLQRDDETFPKARQISGRRVGWLYRELVEWSESRPISDLPPPPNTGRDKAAASA